MLDVVAAFGAYSLAMLLRFADEGAIPASYAARLAPWLVVASVVNLAVGEGMSRLRRPRGLLAHRPILPFVLGILAAVGLVLVLNYALAPLPLRLPLSVAVIAPILAAAASAAVRIAAVRPAPAAEDLLPRPMVELDAEACAPVIRGKRVLITGAAGSIGSELARQVLAVGPSELLLLDANESGLYDLEAELEPGAARHGVSVRMLMANVTAADRLAALIGEVRPEVVFHAAAYKHVPLVEANPEQGFVTNVLGTLAVCQAAGSAGAERVVIISTDKAVRPSSFMGLTKRLAELIVVALGIEYPATRFSAVRFGNVLGSRGSVVPTLLRQIEAGGPLTITHPDAYRFFMTISEAASLVIRSAAFGGSGAVFVLDMGEELRIVDLAERLVRLKGLRPGRDVSMAFVGLRPGEKLREELVGEHERLGPTDHRHVRRVEADYAVDRAALLRGIQDLDARRVAGEVSGEGYTEAVRAILQQAIRPHHPVRHLQAC